MKKRLFALWISLLLIFPLLPLNASAAGYVASKNSDVYHKIGCSYVNSIKDKNKVYYDTPEEAENAGKRGCSRCKPDSGSNSADSTASIFADTNTYVDGFYAGKEAGYREGHYNGREEGYEDGKAHGYSQGYREGQEDAMVDIEERIEAERKDAASDAYILCAVFGFPFCFTISFCIVGGINNASKKRTK